MVALVEQLDRLRGVGFATVEVLHKTGPFAAFGALKRKWRMAGTARWCHY